MDRSDHGLESQRVRLARDDLGLGIAVLIDLRQRRLLDGSALRVGSQRTALVVAEVRVASKVGAVGIGQNGRGGVRAGRRLDMAGLGELDLGDGPVLGRHGGRAGHPLGILEQTNAVGADAGLAVGGHAIVEFRVGAHRHGVEDGAVGIVGVVDARHGVERLARVLDATGHQVGAALHIHRHAPATLANFLLNIHHRHLGRLSSALRRGVQAKVERLVLVVEVLEGLLLDMPPVEDDKHDDGDGDGDAAGDQPDARGRGNSKASSIHGSEDDGGTTVGGLLARVRILTRAAAGLGASSDDRAGIPGVQRLGGTRDVLVGGDQDIEIELSGIAVGQDMGSASRMVVGEVRGVVIAVHDGTRWQHVIRRC